ncbi:hypothetical protein [Paracoccus methylarcula]|uniref:Lipoprotein n=1 Tax=Paracoccus methylarcula TaxID=72022 RepID=A0A422R1E1_9RHOB|nr:hypothetical protein [Paracoccus methylarcula]RNF36065.1 hypothetical protein A7A09_001270 [Paracoccus methylarcula]
MHYFGKISSIAVLALLSLSGCGDDGPTAADIEEAYESRQEEWRANLIDEYGSEENVPGVEWGFASVSHEVDLTSCEKNSDDRGWLCVYDLRAFAINGNELPVSPIKDVEARVFEVSSGWAVEESERE